MNQKDVSMNPATRGQKMLLWSSPEISNGYTETFTSGAQPFFIEISGDMSSLEGAYANGRVEVEKQMASGEWVPVTNRLYWTTGQDIFRLAPGSVGRVRVHDCQGVVIDMHDSNPAQEA